MRKPEYIIDDSREFTPLDISEEECDEIIEREMKKIVQKQEKESR